MGTRGWSRDEYTTYSRSKSLSTSSANQIYTSKDLETDLNPKNITVRESRDSEIHPNSTPIILGLDVTGSMNPVLKEVIVQLGKLLNNLLENPYVSDPHIMCMGIGDMLCDVAPLQVTQFETDIKIATELSRIWLENGGGPNEHESYTLPWLFASKKCVCDNWEKRNKKGYIFTIGDEEINPKLYGSQLRNQLGFTDVNNEYTSNELYEMVSEKWHTFHIHLNFRKHSKENIEKSWRNVIGQNLLTIDDMKDLPKTIISAIQISQGLCPDTLNESDLENTVNSFNLH